MPGARPSRPDRGIRFAHDSPLEEGGFEPSVPGQKDLCKHRDRRRSRAPFEPYQLRISGLVAGKRRAPGIPLSESRGDIARSLPASGHQLRSPWVAL
jgi:hypothetical protein